MVTISSLFDDKRIYYGVIAAGCLAVASLGWVGYRWYRVDKERAAYKELAEAIDSYGKIITTTDAVDQLTDSERAFLASAEQHKSSVLFPFFLAFHADALIRLGKIREAADQLDIAVKAMDASQPLYYLYALKAALVKIDTQDVSLEKEGRAQLATLASQTSNPLRTMAQFYSALDADTQGDRTRAVSLYKEIIAQSKKDSYWYQLADAKLSAGD